jgi:hypothetical protein
VTLETRTRHQCPFPLWPHSARPGDPGYGHVCGDPATHGAWCEEHAKLAAASRSEAAKHERMNRTAVRKARSLGAA